MTRHQTYKSAAIVAAAISVVGTWGLVRAQERANSPRPAPAVPAPPGTTLQVPITDRLFNNNIPGAGTGTWSYAVPVESDPETARLAQAEAELAHNADELLSQYIAAEKADDQKRLKSDLRDMLVKQFDVQRQRRDLELKRIEERVQKLRDQIKKRNDAKETIIDRRLEQLTNEAEGLGWGQPAGPVNVRQPGAVYRTDAKR